MKLQRRQTKENAANHEPRTAGKKATQNREEQRAWGWGVPLHLGNLPQPGGGGTLRA